MLLQIYMVIYIEFQDKKTGLLITKVALIMIFSNYTVSYKNTSSDNDAIHVFTYAANGLYVKFKKRN